KQPLLISGADLAAMRVDASMTGYMVIDTTAQVPKVYDGAAWVEISALGGPYLPLAGGTMAGSIAMGTNNITNVGSLSGAANTRSVDDIVANAGASVNGNVAVFSGVTGKVIAD